LLRRRGAVRKASFLFSYPSQRPGAFQSKQKRFLHVSLHSGALLSVFLMLGQGRAVREVR